MYFHILETRAATGSFYTYWSGRETQRIFDVHQRSAIVYNTRRAIRLLLLGLKPDDLVWFTYDDDLSPRALLKYEIWRRAVVSAGYGVTETPLRHGRKAWRAERIKPPRVDKVHTAPDPQGCEE
ncbi:hypothetical protein [Methylobacterium sp. CCH5-D2]|uniref:hypothetical protein n=1 Tax=Methylobacterium sp. CCH5-D2 TaxID=1768765 RepID=UPI000AFCD2FE|nr:hypothetical protein [Methylobacterium sp. CCH5-D2]